MDGHRRVLVDPHQQAVHWTCCHPFLDIADQTRGIGKARKAIVEEGEATFVPGLDTEHMTVLMHVYCPAPCQCSAFYMSYVST